MKKESAKITESSLESARIRTILTTAPSFGMTGFNANVVSVNFLVRNQLTLVLNLLLVNAINSAMKLNVKSASTMLIKRVRNKLQSVRFRNA